MKNSRHSFKAYLATFLVRMLGWRLEVCDVPKKCVLIGAPHTSNWDGFMMVMAGWKGGFSMKFLGKDALFRFPLSIVVKAFGGIPVERSNPHGLVGALKERFDASEEFRLAITPEGTRSWRPFWKSGFYHIALGANVPVALGFVDKKNKIIGVDRVIQLSGDLTADMDKIREFYKDKEGIHSELKSPVRLRVEVPADELKRLGYEN